VTLFLAAGAAFWLGLLTSVSPCPLATNLAALTFLSRELGQGKRLTLSGLAYVAGRTVAYAVLGALAVAGLLNLPTVSQFLQRHMNQLLGPLLLLAGMFLLDLLALPFLAKFGSAETAQRAGRGGVPGAFLLGALFALSFCPVSAALFFGSLVPLAVKEDSPWLLPALFGVGTGLPVAALALVFAAGGTAMGRLLHQMDRFQRGARLATGLAFLAVGIYLSVKFIFLG